MKWMLPALLLAAVGWAGDREVAEWTLFMGGAVGVKGTPGLIRDIARLPDGPVELEIVDWVGMNVDPPDLERLSGLAHLRELHLPGPIWNRNADGNRDGSRDLRFLASVASLERLTFSYHFLDRIRFHDAGLEEIAGLAHLRELVLRQSGIRGHSLGPFHELRALDVTLTPLDDEGFSHVRDMPHLQRLWAGDTLITDRGLDAIAGLAELEDLDLHGSRVSDSGLSSLRRLTGLRKLNLMGTEITDAGLAQLAGLTRLEELNLYRTRVTNAGLDRLKQLAALRQVDLRYTRATQAGVSDLHAALPNARLIFLDNSARASAPPAASRRVAGQGDAAVAKWVESMGGAARREAGRLVEISLASTPITDALLENLTGLAYLRKLDLEGTEIGDLGMRHLRSLAGLTELSLNSTQV
ncbi:MAG TPA: hypothetical protein VG672_13725, partial [Bryobacteraceae bacterium]|nr:hypothetical protein [Bryobacteraceae bacterium]